MHLILIIWFILDHCSMFRLLECLFSLSLSFIVYFGLVISTYCIHESKLLNFAIPDLFVFITKDSKVNSVLLLVKLHLMS
jgi:hypothetical protein